MAASCADMTRPLIAFTGLAGSGKTTAANRLVEVHGYTRTRFADPLKNMLRALGLTDAEIEGDRKEQPCELLGGRTPRHAMQTLGTEWGRDLIDPDLWTRAWQHALDLLPHGVPVVVDDCRFFNEEQAVHALGGIVVLVDRPGAGAKGIAANHNSEGQPLKSDCTVWNCGSLELLYRIVDRLADDLKWWTGSDNRDACEKP